MLGLLVGLALVGMLAGVVWMLDAGPLRFAFLDRPIATAIGALTPDLVAEVGETTLVRAGRGVALQVAGLRLLGRGGGTILSLPEVRVRPSLGALLRGRVVIARIDVADAALALRRRADGVWMVGAGTGDAGLPVGGVLGAAGGAGGQSAMPRITLARTRLSIDDERTGAITTLDDGDLVLSAHDGRLDVTLAAVLEVTSAGAAAPGRLRLPMRAEASAALASGGMLGDVQLALTGDAGAFQPLGDAGTPLTLAGVAATGTYLPAAETLRFTRLGETVGSSRLEATASIILRDTPTVTLDGTVDALTLAGLARLWPPALAPAVRGWLAANLRAGELRRCRVQLGLQTAAAPASTYDVACDFAGVTADYLAPLEPIRAASGSARLTAERFVVDVRSGTVGACRVDGGTLTMELGVDPTRATIVADVSGATSDVLALVERPPIAFVPPLGIVRTDVGGESRVHAELRLPIKAGLDATEVEVRATAGLTAASLPALAAGVGLSDGRLDVRIDGATVEVKGTASLTGLPAAAGPVQVALTASPQGSGGERQVALTLQGDGIGVKGRATIGAAGLTRIAVDLLRIGGSDVAGSVGRGSSGDWDVILGGPLLDLERLLGGTPLGATDTAALDAGYAVSLDLGRVRTRGGVDLRNVRGSLHGRGTSLGAFDLAAGLAAAGDVRATLASGGGQRPLSVTAPEAGLFLQAFAGMHQIVGGTLALDATTDPRGPLTFLEGTLVLRDFKVVRAPIVARILGLGSLGGIAALVQGDGLPIGEARIPFRWDGTRLALHDVRAIGAVGITADGVLDPTAGTVELRGNVIPAYSLNSVLGKVPVLGRFLVGAKGDGVFGIDYSVAGTTTDPKVSVNPLTSVAPTVLRSWFVEPFRAAAAGQAPRATPISAWRARRGR